MYACMYMCVYIPFTIRNLKVFNVFYLPIFPSSLVTKLNSYLTHTELSPILVYFLFLFQTLNNFMMFNRIF